MLLITEHKYYGSEQVDIDDRWIWILHPVVQVITIISARFESDYMHTEWSYQLFLGQVIQVVFYLSVLSF